MSGDPARDRSVSHAFGVFCRAIVAPIILAAYRTRVIGEENVPQGAAVLCGNHVSNMDSVLLWCAAPRPARFMAKSEAWKSRVLAWVLPRAWAFPVNRGGADRRAISTAAEVLAEGHLLAVFPEGTRVREGTGEAHNGAAYLAIRADAPVVPLALAGTERIKPPGARIVRFPRVTIKYGEPIYPSSYSEAGRKERVQALTAEIMRRIAQELEEARRA